MNGVTGCLTGRVGSDPDFRYSANGKPFLTFSLAADDAKKGQDDPTEWVKVAAFGELAEGMHGQIVKGTRVYAEGRLRLEQWTGQDGTQRSTLKLAAWVLTPMGLESRRPRSGRQHGPQEGRSGPWNRETPRRMPEGVAVHGTRVTGAATVADSDDDLQSLPF